MPEGTQPTEQVIENPQEVETEVGAPTEPGNEPSDASEEVETNEVSDNSEGEQESAETEEPTVDEWLEGLTPNERAKYAKRYPSAWKALQSPDTPEDLKHLLRDKINSDYEIQRLKSQNQSAEEEEPSPEEEQAEEEKPQQPQKLSPEQRQEWYGQIRTYVKQSFDPDALNDVGSQFFESLGYTPGNDPAKGQYSKELADRVGTFLAVQGVNLINSMMSDQRFASRFVQQYLPAELNEVVTEKTWAKTWGSVKNSNPDYAELPDYGTKEFSKAIESFKKAHSWYEEVKWTPQAQAKAMAQFLSGQKVTPPTVKQAFEKGKQAAEQASRSAKLGKLGAGKPTGQFAPKNQDDAFRSAIERYNQSQRSTGK